jgi:hypothetical protein
MSFKQNIFIKKINKNNSIILKKRGINLYIQKHLTGFNEK